MVEIVDTDNDQGDQITWLSNLMFPMDNATLLAGATATSFDEMAVKNENPYLVFNENNNIWKTTENTPLYENNLTSGTINEDIEGQARPNNSNPGADHYSLESVRYAPLSPDDVGPNAFEDISTSTSDQFEINEVLAFPVPTNDLLQLSNIDSKINKVEIVNLEGRIVLSMNIQDTVRNLTINTSNLTNGIYIVKLSKKNKDSTSKKIVIQH